MEQGTKRPASAFSLRKLTAGQIDRIAKLYRSGRYGTQQEIARAFGVSQFTISEIARGKKTI